MWSPLPNLTEIQALFKQPVLGQMCINFIGSRVHLRKGVRQVTWEVVLGPSAWQFFKNCVAASPIDLQTQWISLYVLWHGCSFHPQEIKGVVKLAALQAVVISWLVSQVEMNTQEVLGCYKDVCCLRMGACDKQVIPSYYLMLKYLPTFT